MDVSKLSMLACKAYPVMIWNSLLSVFKSERCRSSVYKHTSNHLDIIGDKADFILNLKAWMTGLFKTQISFTWKGDKNVLDNHTAGELHLVPEPPA
jgi:hypothetical protein